MSRIAQAWRALEREQRMAVVASLGLFLAMFLPWYEKTYVVAATAGALRHAQTTLNAFEAFSFVEAAVLLVAAAVLALLFYRAEGRAFQLPGGDGAIVMIAGGWAALLIFYRLLDKPSLQGTQRITATVGVEWGIFIALLLALALLYAGAQMRAAERPEPPLRRRHEPHRPLSDDPAAEPISAHEPEPHAGPEPVSDLGALTPRPATAAGSAAAAGGDRDPVGARPGGRPRYPPAPPQQPSLEDAPQAGGRPRYPPAPPQQMSFEDPPGGD